MLGRTKKYLKNSYGKESDYKYKPESNQNIKYHYEYLSKNEEQRR